MQTTEANDLYHEYQAMIEELTEEVLQKGIMKEIHWSTKTFVEVLPMVNQFIKESESFKEQITKLNEISEFHRERQEHEMLELRALFFEKSNELSTQTDRMQNAIIRKMTEEISAHKMEMESQAARTHKFLYYTLGSSVLANLLVILIFIFG
ncbi:hypothetical protein B14911_03434 [Bacillus sp. NRRL B-14911]|uniref:Uncharacterized protein n=1 Tax=Bacillus infantis NRRL B-14911 TaxID=1367477 RepID=U5LG78_9BACI|nr:MULTISPECIES: hypothetical protein [Bacillus]AGX06470.1 hypothetical protein N288_23155 [Bacillus infantis NRRL B-14911]EAR68603.1 hypothetical protein B14911_03434 [Bacillus sp. NRRL B-14911]